jgi:hypothetical protein
MGGKSAGLANRREVGGPFGGAGLGGTAVPCRTGKRPTTSGALRRRRTLPGTLVVGPYQRLICASSGALRGACGELVWRREKPENKNDPQKRTTSHKRRTAQECPGPFDRPSAVRRSRRSPRSQSPASADGNVRRTPRALCWDRPRGLCWTRATVRARRHSSASASRSRAISCARRYCHCHISGTSLRRPLVVVGSALAGVGSEHDRGNLEQSDRDDDQDDRSEKLHLRPPFCNRLGVIYRLRRR